MKKEKPYNQHPSRYVHTQMKPLAQDNTIPEKLQHLATDGDNFSLLCIEVVLQIGCKLHLRFPFSLPFLPLCLPTLVPSSPGALRPSNPSSLPSFSVLSLLSSPSSPCNVFNVRGPRLSSNLEHLGLALYEPLVVGLHIVATRSICARSVWSCTYVSCCHTCISSLPSPSASVISLQPFSFHDLASTATRASSSCSQLVPERLMMLSRYEQRTLLVEQKTRLDQARCTLRVANVHRVLRTTQEMARV